MEDQLTIWLADLGIEATEVYCGDGHECPMCSSRPLPRAA
jgi:hypothetical protein